MAVTETARRKRVDTKIDTTSRRVWGPAHFLAMAAVPLLAYQIWTWVAWLASGPYQVTAYRDTSSFSWYAAHTLEIVMGIVVVALVIYLVRQCRQQRRLTFDAMMFIGLVCTLFWDTITNAIEPLWLYSTNWVNLNDWWGSAPFIVRPAAGEGPNPILVLGLLYALGTLEAMMLSTTMRRARNRWPGITTARLLAFTFVPAALVGAVLSMTMIVPHLWAGPGFGAQLIDTDNYRYSLFEFLYIGAWSTTLGSLRFFVNERGERLTERGLSHLPARRRTAVSLLATIGACNLSVILWSIPVLFSGFHSHEYPDYPPSLTNVICDTPGHQGSEYGPCPGSPDFKIPLR